MTEMVSKKTGLSNREALQTIVGALSERLEGLTTALTILGVQFNDPSMLASGLLLSLALKFADSIRLKELEDALSQTQRALGNSRTVEWNERNVRALFMHFELFMQENFEAKRALLRGVIERFVKNGLEQFTDDEKALFIKITEDFTPSDIEYLTSCMEEEQTGKSTPITQAQQLFGIGRIADADPERYRNLCALTGTGLAHTQNVLGGMGFELTSVAFRYYEFLTGKHLTVQKR